jgi:integrase
VKKLISGSPQTNHKLYYACLNIYPDGKTRKTKWIPTGLPERGNKKNAAAITDKLRTLFNRDGSLIPKYADAMKPVEKVALDHPDLPEVTIMSLREMFGEAEKLINPDLEKAIISANTPSADKEQPEVIRKMLYCDYAVQWLEKLAPTLERGTYGGYKIIVHGRVYSYFRDLGVTVEELRPGHIEAFYRYLSVSENLAPNSVIHYHNNIRKSLQTLYLKQIIPNNPADLIDNRPERTTYQAKFFDEDELNEYLSIVKGTKMELPVLFASYYGFRRSEALGIKDSAVNFKTRKLTVQHTVVTVNTDNKIETIRKDRTKNKSSLRTMPLVDIVEDAIMRSEEQQEHYRRKLGSLYCMKDREYFCRDELGRLLDPGYVTRKHKEILEKYGLRLIRYHDLRHSCATVLLSKGVPLEQIQQWLGHADIQTTMRYAHMDVSKAKNDIAGIMNRVIRIG